MSMRISLLRRNILFLWFQWHFVDAPKEIAKAWKNFLLFNLRFFSILFLLKTFFSYWHKYQWHYAKSWDILKNLEVFFSNSVSRIMGAIIRFFLIVIGLLVETIIFIVGIFVFILWIFLPILPIIGIIAGLSLIYYA